MGDKRKLLAYQRAVNRIDDYFEYQYKSSSQEDNKGFVMGVLEDLTNDLDEQNVKWVVFDDSDVVHCVHSNGARRNETMCHIHYSDTVELQESAPDGKRICGNCRKRNIW